MANNNFAFMPNMGFNNPMPQQQPQQQSGLSIDEVRSEDEANRYWVAPGMTAVLMNFQEKVFYIKSSPMGTVPPPLRTFRFEEVVPQPVVQAQNDPSQQNQIDELREMINNLAVNMNSLIQNQNGNNRNNNNQKKGGNQS